MSSIFFVHIPKTAGTSFRKSAEDYFGADNVTYDYSPKSSETSDIVKSVVYGLGDMFEFGKLLQRDGKKFLSGHVPSEKYVNLFGVDQAVTFLRDPIQRVMSEYNHFVRHNGYEGDFSSFYRKPQFINRLSKILNQTPLEAFGMLGLTEDYESSLKMFNDRYATNIQHTIMNTGRDDKEKEYDIPLAQLDELRLLNDIDLKLYESGARIFKQRKQLFMEKLPFVHGLVQVVNQTSLQGWAWFSDRDAPVDIDVFQDGKKLSTVKAHSLKPGLLRLRPPRDGYVGFQLNFPKPLNAGSLVKVVVAETGQVLGESKV